MDGARFANAVVALGVTPKELTWESGVDVLCFGGSKNGIALGEAVVFFNPELAREFDYRCKQGGQLASKMRFLSAPWVGMLQDGAWLRHAKHSNAMARRLEAAIRQLPHVEIAYPVQTNTVFARLPEAVIQGMYQRGWKFYTHVSPDSARLMTQLGYDGGRCGCVRGGFGGPCGQIGPIRPMRRHWHFTAPLPLLTAASMLLAGRAFALDEAPYGVAKEPWAEGLGNHRAVVRVEQKADAVVVKIPWRRRDHDPERKQILIVDATNGQSITNVARLHLDRFEGVLAFQPQTAPGDYFVYYLPFTPQPGWGNYDRDYLPAQETAAPEWKARLPHDADALPRAAVVLLEARTEFDSFYPMEVVATPAETQTLLERSAASAYLLFPEDRRFPIRMTDEVPLRWVKSGPGTGFRGEAQRNEFYVFQIGIWAARTNVAGLDVEFRGDITRWLNCFNTGGTNWDGKYFHKTINVPQGKVQALWIGVDVPRDASPGEHRATVTIYPTNAAPAEIELTLTVLPTELADRGDSEPWRLARLRWLDSTLGSDDAPVGSERPLSVSQRAAQGEGFQISLDGSQVCDMPGSLRSRGGELLQEAMGLYIDAANDSFGPPRRSILSSSSGDGTGRAKLASGHEYSNLVGHSTATVESDGNITFATRLRGLRDFKADNLRLEIPLRAESLLT